MTTRRGTKRLPISPRPQRAASNRSAHRHGAEGKIKIWHQLGKIEGQC